MISTRDLSRLPDVEGLRRTLQSMAMLEAVLCPGWQFRYDSFNAAWGAGEQMGSMRNGSGDGFLAHFSPVGCWLKGFAHDSPVLPAGNRLNGGWVNPTGTSQPASDIYSWGDGAAGGDCELCFNILAGDFNGDAVVSQVGLAYGRAGPLIPRSDASRCTAWPRKFWLRLGRAETPSGSPGW